VIHKRAIAKLRAQDWFAIAIQPRDFWIAAPLRGSQ